MKRLHFSSFRQRLNAAFLAVSLVPMLLCSGLLLQIFRLRMTSNAQQTAQQQLSASCEALDTLHSGFLQTAASLQHNPLVAQALFDAEAEDTAVYSQLFDATESVRSFARFDLYDISGRWRYSTQTAPEIRSLPTNWGLLYEAACAGTGVLVCSAAEDPADTDEPLLHAAMLLTDRYGAPVGYLTIGMLETQLRTLLGGTAGAQNELLLLDARWRPVYCTQPAQTQSLADALRGQLLSGKALTGLSADVSYTVRQHTETGLYLVLQQPQPLSAGTLRLLYSVSVLCALACIILSVVLSLQLSRQVFQPIGRLHHAIRQVGKNNLDVQVPVPAGRHDELGELAQQFNTMVVALRHNQQALLENQRALNRADPHAAGAAKPAFSVQHARHHEVDQQNQSSAAGGADVNESCRYPSLLHHAGRICPPAAGVGDFEPVRRDSAHPPVGKLLIHGSRAGGASFVHGSENAPAAAGRECHSARPFRCRTR